MKSEMKACLADALNHEFDRQMLSSGFSRRKNTLIYSRRLRETVQRIEVLLETHPADCPNAAVAIYPWLTVSMNSVNSIVKEMTGGDTTVKGGVEITLREPIEFTSPKGIGARWFVIQSDSVLGIVAEMGEFVQRWVIPFLDFYKDPEAICDAYNNKDRRVINTTKQEIRVIAAMLLLGRVSDALRTAEATFGKPGLRKRYGNVFQYLNDHSASL